MTEWTVVTVVAALAALITAVAKPLIKLNGSISRLTEAVNQLESKIAALTEKNAESHARLWRKSDEQDRQISAHETQLRVMESRESMPS